MTKENFVKQYGKRFFHAEEMYDMIQDVIISTFPELQQMYSIKNIEKAQESIKEIMDTMGLKVPGTEENEKPSSLHINLDVGYDIPNIAQKYNETVNLLTTDLANVKSQFETNLYERNKILVRKTMLESAIQSLKTLYERITS